MTPARFAWVMSDLSEMCLDFRCHFNRIGTAEHKWRHFDSSSEGYRRNMYIFLSTYEGMSQKLKTWKDNFIELTDSRDFFHFNITVWVVFAS